MSLLHELIAAKMTGGGGGGGGTAVLYGIHSLQFESSSQQVEEVVLSVPDLDTALSFGEILTGPKTVRLHDISGIPKLFINGGSQKYNRNKLEVVDLNGAIVITGTNNIRYAYKLREINATLRLESDFNPSYVPKLQTIFFVENNNAKNISISGAPSLSDNSLISAANGMSETTAKTFATSNSQKKRLNVIVGVVTEKGEVGSEYHFFTEDANGTVTLMDFITNTKGWTVA